MELDVLGIPTGKSPLAEAVFKNKTKIFLEGIVSEVYTESIIDSNHRIKKRAGTMDVVIKNHLEKPINVNINWGSEFCETSGIRAMPQKNTLRLLGREGPNEYYDLGAISPAYRRIVSPSVSETTSEDNLNVQYLREGEVHIFSKDRKAPGLTSEQLEKLLSTGTITNEIKPHYARGAEIYLNADGEITLSNIGHKLIKLDQNSNLYTDVLNYILTLPEGNGINFGDAARINPVTYSSNIYTGNPLPPPAPPLPYTSALHAAGKKPIKELRIKVGTENTKGEPVATITIGDEVLSDFPVLSEGDSSLPKKKLVCKIDFSNGAQININADGEININQGKQTSAIIVPGKSKQRAAREGDNIEVPMTPSAIDLSHPKQAANASANYIAFTALVPSLMSPMGPLVAFVPAASVKLKGNIVEGSDKTFIGDGGGLI